MVDEHTINTIRFHYEYLSVTLINLPLQKPCTMSPGNCVIFHGLWKIYFANVVVESPTGKRRLGRPRRRCEDNIRMDFKEICINTRN